MTLRLVIGNKNYSSWSLRPWIAMKVAGIGFEETVIPLYEPGSRERILEVSPTGKVPVLIDGDIRVWESLAILDSLADRFPNAGLWPSERAGFHTYDIGVDAAASQYMAAIMALPAWQEWQSAAAREPWVMPGNEFD